MVDEVLVARLARLALQETSVGSLRGGFSQVHPKRGYLLPEEGPLSTGFCVCVFVSRPDSPLARGSLGSDFNVTVCGSLRRKQELAGVRDSFGPLLSCSLPAILFKNKTIIRPSPSFTNCLVSVCEAHWKWKVLSAD